MYKKFKIYSNTINNCIKIQCLKITEKVPTKKSNQFPRLKDLIYSPKDLNSPLNINNNNTVDSIIIKNIAIIYIMKHSTNPTVLEGKICKQLMNTNFKLNKSSTNIIKSIKHIANTNDLVVTKSYIILSSQ